MATVPVYETFYVGAMNIEIQADKATIPSGNQTTEFSSDVKAELNVSLDLVQNLFKFQSDAIDINDLDAEDLKYKVDYVPNVLVDANGIPDIVLSEDFLSNTLCYSVGTVGTDTAYENTASATDKSIAADYIRSLAVSLFNVATGVDLFDNESEVKDSINYRARESLHNLLVALTEANSGSYLTKDESTDQLGTFYVAFGNNHPTYEIIAQMLANVPERFQTINDYAVAGDVNSSQTFCTPFAAGDAIVLKLLINASPDQGDIINGNVDFSGGRIYAIKLNIISDDSLGGVGGGSGGVGGG